MLRNAPGTWLRKLKVAVALAAFLVLFLAPAMLMLFGKRTWSLPGFLDKIIPDLDLEGNSRVIPDGTAAPVSPAASANDGVAPS